MWKMLLESYGGKYINCFEAVPKQISVVTLTAALCSRLPVPCSLSNP